MEKPKCPYTFPHRSRAAKVDYLCNIGGYSASYRERWPIEFNVSVACADLSFERLWGTYFKDFVFSISEEEQPTYKQVALQVFNDINEYLYDWAIEDCQRDLDPGEGDTYFMLYDGTKPLDVALSLRGRQGKHLVIERFRSLTLTGLTDDELHDLLMCQDNGYNECTESTKLKKGYAWKYDAAFVDTLYRYVRQCEVDFTPKNASLDLESNAAYHFFSRVDDAWEERNKSQRVHADLVKAAKRVAQSIECDHAEHSHLPRDAELDDAFATLCRAAGVSEEDING